RLRLLVALPLPPIGLTPLPSSEFYSTPKDLTVWRAPKILALPYLFPPIFISVFFGSSAAVMTSFASALAASYFIYAPQFSFLIQDPRHIGELVFILVLAITASKAIGVITGDPLARRREKT